MNEFLMSSMSFLATLFDGSMGWAIVLLALAVRLAILPLTLHLARRMLANQAKVKALQPEVDAIKARHAANPREMFAAISALYKENGAYMIDRSSLFGALIQLPVFALVYKAIGNVANGSGPFLWMKTLATPDAALTALVLVLTAIAAYYFPSVGGDVALLVIAVQIVVTAVIMWQLSAALGLYWAAASSVSVVQTVILQRDRRLAMANPA